MQHVVLSHLVTWNLPGYFPRTCTVFGHCAQDLMLQLHQITNPEEALQGTLEPSWHLTKAFDHVRHDPITT